MRTDEELNGVIAEWCGWTIEVKEMDEYPFVVHSENRNYTPTCYKSVEQALEGIPDYCNDLNATNNAEKKLIFSKRESYIRNLLRILSAGLDDGLMVSEIVFAPSRQRAEALVAVIEGEKK